MKKKNKPQQIVVKPQQIKVMYMVTFFKETLLINQQ
jgi:hypothetical protein